MIIAIRNTVAVRGSGAAALLDKPAVVPEPDVVVAPKFIRQTL